METTNNAARKDPTVREAMKEMQLARLEMKKRVAAGEVEAAEYSALYEQQPEQLLRRRQQEAEKDAIRVAKARAVASGVANAKGAAEVFRAGGTVTSEEI